ncbi:hypothetical protein HPB47_015126, partial [Ixodes persulcatus]
MFGDGPEWPIAARSERFVSPRNENFPVEASATYQLLGCAALTPQPQAYVAATSTPRREAMEVTVEGEPLSLAEASSADWQTIHRRHRLTPGSTNLPPKPNSDRPPSPNVDYPRPPKVARRDYKIILRPQSGLALAALSEITLIRIIQSTAGVPSPGGMQDQIKVCGTANFVIISTPEENHVPLYLGATTLLIQGKEHHFSTHVAAPADTSVGLIHGIPPEDSPDLVLTTLQQHNPRVSILSTRRLGSTGAIQVLFDSPRIPFWLKYDGAQRRCTPFRQQMYVQIQRSTGVWHADSKIPSRTTPAPQHALSATAITPLDTPRAPTGFRNADERLGHEELTPFRHSVPRFLPEGRCLKLALAHPGSPKSQPIEISVPEPIPELLR